MKQNKIWYRKIDGYYELTRPYGIETGIKIPAPARIRGYADLSVDGFLLIQPGYAWDGASGPAIDTLTIMRGSLVHDCLYQMMRLLVIGPEYRAAADLLLKQICLDAGMWRVRAEWVYLAVKTFAARSIAPKGPEPALTEIGAP